MPPRPIYDELTGIRRKLMKGMLIALSVLGFPAVVFALMEAVRFGQSVGAGLYLLLYVAVLITTLLSNRLPLAFGALVILGSLYLISLYNLVEFAFAGAGIELAVAVSVLATVLFGIRIGLTAVAVCLVSLVGVGFGFVSGFLPVVSRMPDTAGLPLSWFTAAVTFTLLAGALVLSSGMLQRHLLISLRKNRQQTAELKQANEELNLEIKQRKAAQRNLKQSEAQFRTLFETAPDAIYLTDIKGVVIDANRAAEDLFGLPRRVLAGQSLQSRNLFAPAEAERIGELLKNAAEGVQTGPDEFGFRNAEKKPMTVEIHTSPFQLHDRQRILWAARDISARKKLESRLKQTQKMEALGTLTGGIAHDFNNILASVIGYAELALDHAEEGSPLRDHLNEVLTAGRRARDLVKQILTMSRHQEQEIKPLRVAPLIREVLKMLRATIPASIEIRENILDESLIVKGDPTQLHQVIVNLATNAKQAVNDESGFLEVALEGVDYDADIRSTYPDMAPGSYVRISVSDNGCGIPKENLEKIFEPYYTTKDKGTGTGLGLAVIHGIVKSHGGQVTVYSEPGRGSTFNVYLPLAREAPAKLPEGFAGPLPAGSEHILAVDDERAILGMLQQSLEGLGYTVTTAAGGPEALETFRASPYRYDLIITDMTMPNMTGDKLAREVKQIRSDIPLILCTGFSEKVNGSGNDPNIDGFLMKPVAKIEMAQMVRKLLDPGGVPSQGA